MPDTSRPTKPQPGEAARTVVGHGKPKTDRAPQLSAKATLKKKSAVSPDELEKAVAHDGDQIPPRGGRVNRSASAEPTTSYVRLRVHVENGEMSVVGSHLVEGELTRPPTLHGPFAYDVTDGEELLHADSLPDMAQVRSFADPNGTGETRGHHMYQQDSYDFDVRVPSKFLTPEALPTIAIAVHRLKDEPRSPLRDVPLTRQLDREVRLVARVVGIPSSVLPPELQPKRTPRRK
jgi:hypothetical protein